MDEFSIFKVLPLNLDLAVELIEKLPFDEDIKNKFVTDLRENLFEKHKSFLSNPLLLSIMLLTYGENAEIPSKLSIFYNQAFEALFQRHDAHKGGYSRSRLTKLDIQDFSRVFALFSLQTYEKRLFKMLKTECLGYIEKSRDCLQKQFEAGDYLNDLLSAACLLIEDGLEIAFSHRSFQEYFVALHISSASPDIQEKLINRYWNKMRSDKVMNLLLEINPELVERILIIPVLQRMFDDLGVKEKVSTLHTVKYFKKCFSSLNVEPDRLSATLKSSKADAADVMHLAVRHCNTFSFRERDNFQSHIERVFKKYGKADGRAEFPTEKLTYRTPLFIDWDKAGGVQSTEYLRAAHEALHKLKSKHVNRMQSLENLLGVS